MGAPAGAATRRLPDPRRRPPPHLLERRCRRVLSPLRWDSGGLPERSRQRQAEIAEPGGAGRGVTLPAVQGAPGSSSGLCVHPSSGVRGLVPPPLAAGQPVSL